MSLHRLKRQAAIWRGPHTLSPLRLDYDSSHTQQALSLTTSLDPDSKGQRSPDARPLFDPRCSPQVESLGRYQPQRAFSDGAGLLRPEAVLRFMGVVWLPLNHQAYDGVRFRPLSLSRQLLFHVFLPQKTKRYALTPSRGRQGIHSFHHQPWAPVADLGLGV